MRDTHFFSKFVFSKTTVLFLSGQQTFGPIYMDRKKIQQLVLCIPMLGILLGSSLSLSAQNKKLDKSLKKANENFQLKKFVEAEQMYKEILKEDNFNITAITRLGKINTQLEDFTEALRWYQTAISLDSARNDTLFLWQGLTYKKLDDCQNARIAFNKFKQKHQIQDILFQRADLEIAGCDFAESPEGQRLFYRIGKPNINSNAADVFPSVLDQRQENKSLIFTSHRAKEGSKPYSGLGQPAFSDLYQVTLINDTTLGGDITNLGAPINTKNNDGASSFSGDGLTMFFTICNDKNNKLGCSIFESRFDPSTKSWGKPSPVAGIAGRQNIVINSKGKTKSFPTDDRHPFITKDGRTLYFASDRPGGLGGYDLWVSNRQGTGWSTPANLGPSINTPFDENSPFLNDDKTKLYFASNGRGGLGGFDIFVSPFADGAWGPPQNVGKPINSNADELGSSWTKNDSLIFFTSNREGGQGSYDIYWAFQTQPLLPGFGDLTLQGLVRDKDTQQPIPFATAILFEYDQDGFIVPTDTFNTDQSARYMFPLQFEKNYKVLGNAPEYLANEIEVSTQGVAPGVLERNIDIELEPITLGRPIVLQNIYYDFDEYFLRPDARAELNRLIAVLNQNPNVAIQLGSHTDSNGTISYNKTLSDNRAKAAVKLLVERGIDPSRLSWFGFGESQPLIYPELSDADEQANRRTEFRIISIDF